MRSRNITRFCEHFLDFRETVSRNGRHSAVANCFASFNEAQSGTASFNSSEKARKQRALVKCIWSSYKRSWNSVNVEEEEGRGIVVEEIAEAQRQPQVFLGL